MTLQSYYYFYLVVTLQICFQDGQNMSDNGLGAAATVPLDGIRQKLSRISMRRNSSIINLFKTNQNDEEHTALTSTGNNTGS